ncbi:MAG: HD domain-containing protein [Lachnospiraceae bacterium]|nr:HD domain-containing protein [Lachnospiraceae bacterium]MBQ1173403.1 HD domain-containing protein [Lachnospiraceae bacterium]
MENRILLVDENEIYRDIMMRILCKEYSVEQVDNVGQAMDYLAKDINGIVAVLVDMLGSTTDGFTLLDAISKSPLHGKIPIIVLCNPTSAEMEEKLYLSEVSECIRQPFNETLIRLKVRNMVQLFQYQNDLEEKIKQQTKRIEMQNTMLKVEADFLQKSNVQIIDLLGVMAEYRNQESGEHIRRIKEYTRIIAEGMMQLYPEKGLTTELINIIVSASSLHDIGKIAITDTILLKPGRLTDKEFEYMKSHTFSGCEILEKLQNAWSKEYGKICKEICLCHHERYDGNGYPNGLKKDEIPLSAQIVSIADVYDALVHERVYKEAIPKDQAYEMIMNGECGIFSPDILNCFTQCRKKMEAL